MKRLILFASLFLLALPAAAQITFEIQSPSPRRFDPNFKVAGTYGFSVAREGNGRYRLYATSGNQRKTWHQGQVKDLKNFPPDPCPILADPTSPGWDFRCQEQIGLYSKFESCTQGSPCQTGGRWDAHPGSNNISTFPVSWLWPRQHPNFGINGFTPVLTKDAANSPAICGGGQCPPPTGVASTCHPANPNAYSKGVANGKVVEVYHGGGNRRWYMAFNTTVKTNNSSGSDRFRIAWASSSDGKNWIPDDTYLLRSSKEADPFCGSQGLLLTDMFIDSGYFRIVFHELRTNKVYMARARIRPFGSDPAFGTWQVGGAIVNGKRTWINLPSNGSQVDLQALGAVSVHTSTHTTVVNRQADINKVYSPNRVPPIEAGDDYLYLMLVVEKRTPGSQPVIQVWTAPTLDDPFVYQSDVDTSSLTRGLFGWEFGLTQYPDNLDNTPRLVGDQLDFWVVQNLSAQGQNAQVTVTRTTARLRGGIFGP